MSSSANTTEMLEEMRTTRQIRLYHPKPVPQDVLQQLLEVARWSGSSRNSQPWHFIVVTDKDELRSLGQLRTPINWLADVPLAIALVLDAQNLTMEAYDEGRVTERLLIAAHVLGLGGGTAWFGDEAQQAEAKRIMGIPQEYDARSVVALGYPVTSKDHRPNANIGGRKPLSEIVSYNRWGNKAG